MRKLINDGWIFSKYRSGTEYETVRDILKSGQPDITEDSPLLTPPMATTCTTSRQQEHRTATVRPLATAWPLPLLCNPAIPQSGGRVRHKGGSNAKRTTLCGESRSNYKNRNNANDTAADEQRKNRKAAAKLHGHSEGRLRRHGGCSAHRARHHGHDEQPRP